ncbi:MAG: glycosyltransferase family 8 protein [Clostridia bacterium]|nr:glycosyltransferase family 8 protein [Clostridia bacterium]MBR0507440.1 glycosyltransferase family 8 protein [Clostridia bacterium]
MQKTVPIFFACNDKYVPYLDVALISLIAHTSPENTYRITVLKNAISERNQAILKRHETDNVTIDFFDVKEMLEPIRKQLPDRFYFSVDAYFRLFIETSFPQYDKAIYLDSDVIVLHDVAELYDTDVGGYLLAAAYEQNTDRNPMFTNYVEDIIGIPHKTYFNSGVMVMNLKEFRRFRVQERFLHMLTQYRFDCLAPDQEYLNVICFGRVKYLPTGWNKHSFPEPPEGELKLCHYALSCKPWHYRDTINGEYFWEYAKDSEFYGLLKSELEGYGEADRERDKAAFSELIKGIEAIYRSDRTFCKLWFGRNADRKEVSHG